MYLTHGYDWYCNLGSLILKYRTWIPLVVKYGMEKFTFIGFLLMMDSGSVTAGKPNSALIENCLPPGNVFNFHIRHDFSGIHFTEPYSGENLGVSASSGIGMITSTLLAVDFFDLCLGCTQNLNTRVFMHFGLAID